MSIILKIVCKYALLRTTNAFSFNQTTIKYIGLYEVSKETFAAENERIGWHHELLVLRLLHQCLRPH